MPNRSACRIVQRHDQIELRFVGKPGKAAAILMQHHANAGLSRPLAPMRPSPLGSLDQAGRMQLRLHPGIAPAEAVLVLQLLEEMPHIPAQVVPAVFIQHPGSLLLRNPLA